MGGAWGGDAGFEEEFARELFAEEGGILDGVIETYFFETAEGLTRGIFGEIEREGGAIIDASEATGGPFEMGGDVSIDDGAIMDGDGGAFFLPVLGHGGGVF